MGLCLLGLVAACKSAGGAGSGLENVDLRDPNAAIRDQELIGSCTSFGFLGMIEQDLHQRTGVSVDLSERYMMLLNLFKNASLSFGPGEEFAAMSQYGVMPESVYPYEEIRKQPSLIQGVQTIEMTPDGTRWDNVHYLEKTLQLLQPLSLNERNELLKQNDYLGKPKTTEKKFAVPVDAVAIKDRSKIPTFGEQNVPCYKLPGESSAQTATATAVEFYVACVAKPIEISKYFWCNTEEIQRDAALRNKFDLLARKILDQGSTVTIAARLSDRSRTAFFSVNPILGYGETDPIVEKDKLLTSNNYHQFLVVGYLSKEELADPAKHAEGFLQGGGFEELDLLYDLTLTGVRERVYGELNPLIEKLPPAAQEKLKPLLKKRRELYAQYFDLRAELSRLGDDLLSPNWIGSSAYRDKLQVANDKRSVIKAKEAEIVELCQAELAEADFIEFAKRQRAVVRATADQTSFPFEVGIDRERGKLYATLKGFPDWRIKEVDWVDPAAAPAEKAALRGRSKLAAVINAEGGFFMLRNSWGVANGVRGHYFITFDYFRKFTDRILGRNLRDFGASSNLCVSNLDSITP